MICGHCKYGDADIEHVKTCAAETYAMSSALRNLADHDAATVEVEIDCDAEGEPFVCHTYNTTPKTAPRTPVTEAGMYRTPNGEIYKVQAAVHGSGHLYAKQLIVATSGDPGDPDVSVGFEYAPGVIFGLAAEDRMTLEEAKEFGALYGTCCVCGRTLTNENSIDHGIGPVCAGKL